MTALLNLFLIANIELLQHILTNSFICFCDVPSKGFKEALLRGKPWYLSQLSFCMFGLYVYFQIAFSDSISTSDFPFLESETIDEYIKNDTTIEWAKIRLFHCHLRFFKAIANLSIDIYNIQVLNTTWVNSSP